MAKFYLSEMPPPRRGRMPAHPSTAHKDKDPEAYAAAQQWKADMQARAQQREIEAEKQRKIKDERNRKASAELNRRSDVVMSALQEQANARPFTSEAYNEAINQQVQEKQDKWQDYKKGINATMTAAELGLSGASLVGAYANWRNWANAANVGKRTIANLLQRAQLPMQISGTVLDGFQTLEGALSDNMFDTYYNAGSAGLGIAGSVGASDVFLNSRFHNPKIDRILDTMGIIQNAGDFIKFGYDKYKSNK